MDMDDDFFFFKVIFVVVLVVSCVATYYKYKIVSELGSKAIEVWRDK